jgi:hypothetical protein
MNEFVFTPEKRREFLQALRETCNVTLAARAGGVSRRRVYQVREEEPDFAKQWDDALEEGIDLLEHEAQRRAFAGVDKPVFYQGCECGRVREYSDTLTIFLLKAHRPDRFRDNSKVELGGSLDLRRLTDDEIDAELAQLAALEAAGALRSGQDEPDCADLV